MSVTRTNGIICPTPTAWAQSGTHLAVPFGRLLQIYDVTTSPPKRIVTPSPHESTISTVVGLPGMQFASSSHDSTVKLWDVLEGHCLRTIDIGSAILNMCAIPGALLCVTKQRFIRKEIEPPYKSSTIMTKPFPESTRVAASSDGSVVALIAEDTLFLFSLAGARDQIDDDDDDDKNNNNNAHAPSGTGQKLAALHMVSKQQRIVKKPPHLKVRFQGMLHSVAVSASAKHLVVGGNKGMIYYISDPFRHVQNMTKNQLRYTEISPTELHWHSSPVQALHFTHADTNLLSGGQEGVLVNWTLTSFNFGATNFLPLIGAPILAISVSPNESQYALSLCDNSAILVEQSERKLQSVIRSIACRIEMNARTRITEMASRDDGRYNGYRMVVCNSSNAGCIFVANDNTRIQEFNALCGEHVRNISVVPMNEIFQQSRGDTLSTVTVSRVTHVAMHPNGSFLASVDFIDRHAEVDPSLHNLRRNTVTTLRVWRRDEHDGWSLCSVVVNPHGDNNSVISLLFHPVSNVLLTTGSDNKVKLWRATVLDQGKNTRPQVGTWRCELSKTYRNKRCESACFSDDGSVLALGCENVVALWTVTDLLQLSHDNNKDGSDDIDVGNANVNSKIAAAAAGLVMFEAECSLAVEFCAVLMHPSSFGVEATIQGLQFIMGPIPLFVAASTHGVYVWNALTHDLVWSITVAANPSTLCVDPGTGRFAIAVHVSPITSSLPMPMSMPGHHRNHHHHLGAGVHEGRTTPATRIESIGAVTNVGNTATMMDVDQVATAVKSKKKKKSKRNGTAAGSSAAVKSVSKRGKPKLANHMAHEGSVHDNPTAIAIFDSICPVPVHVHQLAPRVGVSSLTFVESDPTSVNTEGERASGEEQRRQGGQKPHDGAARNDGTVMTDDGAGDGTAITFVRKEHHQHQHQHTLLCIDTNLEVSLIRGGIDNGDRDEDDHHLDVDISLTSDEPLNSAAVGAVLENTTLGHNGPNTAISSSTPTSDAAAGATGKLDSLFGQQWRDDAAAVQADALNTAGVPADGTEEVTGGVMGAIPRKLNHSLLEQAFDDFLTGPVHAQAPISVQSCEFLKALLSIPGELAVTGGSNNMRSSKGLLGGDTVNEDGVDILGALTNDNDDVRNTLPNEDQMGRSNALNRADNVKYNGEAHALEDENVDDNNDNEDDYDMSGEAMLKFCQRLTDGVNMKDGKEGYGPAGVGKRHGQTKNSGIKPSHTPTTAAGDANMENKKSNGKNKSKSKRISDSRPEPTQPPHSGPKPTPKERARDIVRSSSGKNRLNHGHSWPGPTVSTKGRDVRSPGPSGPSGPSSAKKKRLQQRRNSLIKVRPKAD